MKKLSIITAVHNQIEYNRLFLESLAENTFHPYDLIIIDNASHDGSGRLFSDHGALVVRNEANLCYACSQNQGLEKAGTSYFAFCNNDIFLSKHWDKKLIEYMNTLGLDAISPCGIETMEDDVSTRAAMRRWRRINAVQRLYAASGMHYSSHSLRALIKRMYGDWAAFTEKRSKRFEGFLYPGISGNCIMAKRDMFQKIGPWNTRVGASDWDLQLRLVRRQAVQGDVKQCMIAGDVFVHHFIRATFRSVKVPRSCGHAPNEIADVYPPADMRYLNRPKLSLIIAVHNKPEFLEKVFESLSSQTLRDFEVVVADDGSGKEIAELCRKWNAAFSYPIAHVWQEHKGFRKTIIANKAVERSRSDYLCFIDGDCILHHKFLEDHLKTRRVGTVLSGRRVMLDEELTARLTVHEVRTRRIEKPAFWLGHAQKSSIKHGVRLSAVAAIEDAWKKSKNYCILGSNFSVFKGDFYRVNGYEEAIVGRGLEDNNLSNRFKAAGIRIRTVARKAIQYHLFHSFDPAPHTRDVIDRWGTPRNFRAEKGISKIGN
jgi:glycosyltransferase involved in cell wall biosynthesis